MSHYQYHVFFCLNQRDGPRPCCAAQGAESAFEHCKKAVKQAGLAGPGKVRVNRAGCMERCEQGPVCVVYPQGIWYTYVDPQDIDEIVERHLKRGEIVERLRVPEEPAT